MHMHVLEAIKPRGRRIVPESIELPSGYRIEAIVADLNYPSSVSWDADGNLLIAESTFPYGHAAPTEIRVLRREPDGVLTTVIGGLDQPIYDIAVSQGLLYIALRGRIILAEGQRPRPLVTGLPSWGLHANGALAFGPDGRLYFGQGTVSNAGVVGPQELWELRRAGEPQGHDVPGDEVVLTGQSYDVADPATGEVRPTGAFAPWGEAPPAGARLPSAPPGQAASGAILSANRDGSDLRVWAWGFCDPLGLAWDGDRLLVVDRGPRPLPPRPIAGAPDVLWVARQGAWHGWPDFVAGRPVTDPAFAQPDARHPFLLANHGELLGGRAAPPQPLVSLGPQAGASHLDLCRHPSFGFAGQAFVAEFGPLAGPREGMPALPGGHRVVRVDLARRATADLAVNRSRMPASLSANSGGLERPVQAKFGPDGHLYIVDFGVVEFREHGGWVATEATGIIWRVTHRPGAR